MAKWGEGDPRWIVEERPDATNVNNWHWTEKNASQWSKDKLMELLNGLQIHGDVGSCTIYEVDKIEGEASANNRKAKLIFFYEWTLSMKWKGTANNSPMVKVEGVATVPNLSDENSADEVDVEVTTASNSTEAGCLKQMMRTVGTKKIKEQLAKYITSLKEDFTTGMILPKKDDATDAPKTATQDATLKLQVSKSSGDIKKASVGAKIETKKFTCTEMFKCPPMELYNVLTLPELLRAFTNSDVKVDAVVGGKFSLLGGHLTGEFTELVPNRKIRQRWRFRTWPDGHFSDVTINLEDKGDSTELKLTQIGIPESEFENTVEGWNRHFWEAIKRTFGFGAFLM